MKSDIVKRYVSQIKSKFPQASDSEITDAINFTFKYFRMRMGDDDIPDIRIKGFGSFQVFPAPVIKSINSIKKKIDDVNHAYTEYQKQKLKKLENYVEKNSKLFEEYYERRKKST